MPYIQINTSVQLDDKQRKELGAVAKTICTSVLKKPSQYLMVSFVDKLNMQFGDTNEPAAYVDVKIYGSYPTNAEGMITQHLCKALESVCGIPASRTFIGYFQTNQWGWNGRNF